MADAREVGGKSPKGRAPPGPAQRGPEVRHNLEPESGTAERAGARPTGLDYWLGTREGRTKVFIIFWVVSISMMALGYGLMLWIATHGGL